MKRKNESGNFLDKKPAKKEGIVWSTDQSGVVTLEIQNKGFFNFLAQKLFKKPKISYIHLDEMGSFIWPLLDGEMDIAELSKSVDAHFGEKAQPLYERLLKYLLVLESYGFITLE